MTDLIVGAAANYQWETATDCTYQFVVSLRRSGYTGRVVFIVSAPLHPDTLKKYKEYGVELKMIQPMDQYDFPHVFRFRAIPEVIASIPDLRYVMALDVKDILFQSNPVTWLEKNLQTNVLGFHYDELHDDMKYAREFFPHVFGAEAYEEVQWRNVCGAGIICGRPQYISALSQAISDLSEQRREHYIENSYVAPDQQAYNLLLSREPWLSMVETLPFTDNEFVTLGAGDFDFKTGLMHASSGVPHALYHHTGNPHLEVILREKYKG